MLFQDGVWGMSLSHNNGDNIKNTNDHLFSAQLAVCICLTPTILCSLCHHSRLRMWFAVWGGGLFFGFLFCLFVCFSVRRTSCSLKKITNVFKSHPIVKGSARIRTLSVCLKASCSTLSGAVPLTQGCGSSGGRHTWWTEDSRAGGSHWETVGGVSHLSPPLQASFWQGISATL